MGEAPYMILKAYPTPRGGEVLMAHRPDTADEPVIVSTSMHDEYGLAALSFQTGDLALDIGAYVGSVSLALATDWPELRVVMVEAVAENVEVIEASIQANSLESRVVVIHAAAGDGNPQPIKYAALDNVEDGTFMFTNRYVGDLEVAKGPNSVIIPGVSLTDLVMEYGSAAYMKIDCEGCEYPFLDSPAVGNVARITGEYHRGTAGIVERLLRTHRVEFRPENESVGLFDAWRLLS